MELLPNIADFFARNCTKRYYFLLQILGYFKPLLIGRIASLWNVLFVKLFTLFCYNYKSTIKHCLQVQILLSWQTKSSIFKYNVKLSRNSSSAVLENYPNLFFQEQFPTQKPDLGIFKYFQLFQSWVSTLLNTL